MYVVEQVFKCMTAKTGGLFMPSSLRTTSLKRPYSRTLRARRFILLIITFVWLTFVKCVVEQTCSTFCALQNQPHKYYFYMVLNKLCSLKFETLSLPTALHKHLRRLSLVPVRRSCQELSNEV